MATFFVFIVRNPAIDRDDLRIDLRSCEAEIEFRKRDGSRRVMNATLKPEAYAGYEFKGADYEAQDEYHNNLRVWDLDKEDWRTVPLDRIISVDRKFFKGVDMWSA